MIQFNLEYFMGGGGFGRRFFLYLGVWFLYWVYISSWIFWYSLRLRIFFITFYCFIRGFRAWYLFLLLACRSRFQLGQGFLNYLLTDSHEAMHFYPEYNSQHKNTTPQQQPPQQPTPAIKTPPKPHNHPHNNKSL